jgi:AhpD family alkylhydroperoxidase
MERITPINLEAVQGRVKELLGAVKAKLGIVPNMTRSMAVSPPVLDAYLGFIGALGHGVLPARVREQLALDVGEANHCDYCVSAHSLLGKRAGLTELQTYLENNQMRVDYPRYRALGLPIGSGEVEAQCKTLVGGRCKLAGMRNWKYAGAENVLRLRAALQDGSCDGDGHGRELHIAQHLVAHAVGRSGMRAETIDHGQQRDFSQ